MRHKISHSLLIAVVLFWPGLLTYEQSERPTAQLRPIQQNGKWGYMDAAGKIVIEPRFFWAEEFSEGLAAFENEDGKYGYIDETGKVVIEPLFDNWTDFSEGLAAVSVDFHWGYVDKTGKWVIQPQFAGGRLFFDGLASVRVGQGDGEKRGYIDRRGKYVWGPAPFRYKSIEEIQARVEKSRKNEEVLTPLTDEERALNPRDIVADQPDFVADLTFFRSETVSGGGGAMRLARKGNRYRHESQFWIFIGEQEKPAARLFPEAKVYDDMESPREESAGGSSPFNPETLAREPDTTFEALGAVDIDGHRCIKIQAVRKGKPEKIYLYAARDLKNLIIVAQVINPPFAFVQRLANISLEVPDSLVQISSDYRPIEHDRWTKVETARVSYKGKPSKDYGVFRSPGGELFIWVNDAPYDWHYLVRPREGTVETAFQGLLVTRSGEYIWRTSETEAFSKTDYRNQRPGDEMRKEEERAIVTQNSVKFRSNDYEKDKAMIEVRW